LQDLKDFAETVTRDCIIREIKKGRRYRRMNSKQLQELLNELKRELEIPEDEKIRILLRPIKTKVASISLKTEQSNSTKTYTKTGL